MLLSKLSGATELNGYCFYIYQNDIYVGLCNAVISWTSDELAEIGTGSMQHLILTYKNNVVKCYLNNVLEGEATSDVNPTTSAVAFRVGNIAEPFPAPYNDCSYDGLIDEIGIFDSELTESERTTLYNAGTGITIPFIL